MPDITVELMALGAYDELADVKAVVPEARINVMPANSNEEIAA